MEILDPALVTALSDLGTVALLLLILIAGARNWWVFGWHYEEIARERDAWREIALRGLGVAEQLLERLQREQEGSW